MNMPTQFSTPTNQTANISIREATDPSVIDLGSVQRQRQHRSFLYERTSDAAPDDTQTNDGQKLFPLEQVQQLLNQVTTQQLPPPIFHPPPPLPSSDDPYSLLKIEQIASQGLPTKFDRDTANFAQFIQDASSQVSISVPHDLPFIEYCNNHYNIFHDFISIPKSLIESRAYLSLDRPHQTSLSQ